MTVEKIEHGDKARLTLGLHVAPHEVSIIGYAEYSLELKWVEHIAGCLDNVEFSLSPDAMLALSHPTGGIMLVQVDGRDTGLVRFADLEKHLQHEANNYFYIELNCTEYFGFAIGFGRKGQYLCVYRFESGQRRLVAQVDLPTAKTDLPQHYEIHALDKESAQAGVFLVLYYDYFHEEGWVEKPRREKTKSHKFTFRKNIKALYDPGFAERADSFGRLENEARDS